MSVSNTTTTTTPKDPVPQIKLVVLDHKPKKGEQITVGGQTGTYVDDSAIPVDNLPDIGTVRPKFAVNLSKRTAENIEANPLGQMLYLAKQRNEDGTISISYYNFGGKKGTNTNPGWKPITSKELTTETFTTHPKAENYSEPVVITEKQLSASNQELVK